ncbi:MAG: peptidase S8, partial [Chloroflexi bacterium]
MDAYDDPTAEKDLGVYSSTYGLPACTAANGCFRKVNQNGVQGSYPQKNAGWALEIALDVETTHQICQNCSIL